ncbi:hypothetical protein AYI68_g3451 [Smittium mucronatum]|uniref:UspA domain-containing protein n=1 Tax=Smittium mucronatum TaxID=133383 RepID=A0A1R0GZV6_9FUNG|nr:hypothetical protein AYI68_g3451 [Smittium mucronatum]
MGKKARVQQFRKGSLVVSSDDVVEGFPVHTGNPPVGPSTGGAEGEAAAAAVDVEDDDIIQDVVARSSRKTNLQDYQLVSGPSAVAAAAAAGAGAGVGTSDSAVVEVEERIKRIVMVCISGSERTSSQVVEKSLDMLLDKTKDLVILLHVRKTNETSGYTGMSEFVPEQTQINSKFKAESYRVLTHYGNMIKHLGYVTRAISVAGDDPGYEISKKVKELSVDLLIIGKPTKSGLSYFFTGNSCESLFKSCDCSVTMIKID